MKTILFATLLTFTAPAFAQQPAPPAPIPAPILSAQKVFLANGGADLNSIREFPTTIEFDKWRW